MTKTFKEIIDGIRMSVHGIEVREDIAQMGEYVEQFAETSTTKAQEAADSAVAAERAKTDTLAAKTEAVQAISTEKQAGLDAISTAKNGAVSEITTAGSDAVKETQAAHTAALQDIFNARAGVLDDVANSTETAATAASTATKKAEEASSSATAAAESQQAASDSATAAGESQTAAKTAQAKAEAAAELAGTRAGTDKTLTVEDAPADAKAVGDALKNISIDTMTGATAEEAGKAGLVPAPDAGAQGHFLRGDGTWTELTVPEYAEATQTTPGLMNAADKKKLDSLYPVGSIYMSTASASPASFLGGTWEEIASERVLMGASSSHAAGTTVEAGLPNITGTVTNFAKEFSGAFTQGALVDNKLSSGNGINRYTMNFDASLSNPIYGASDTVQPAAYYVHIWHRVA